MRVGKSYHLCNLIVLQGCLLQKLLGLLHSDAAEKFQERSACGFLKNRTELAGTDVQVGTDIIQA